MTPATSVFCRAADNPRHHASSATRRSASSSNATAVRSVLRSRTGRFTATWLLTLSLGSVARTPHRRPCASVPACGQEERPMAYDHILLEREDGVGIVTLNRPEVLNAMNRKLMQELGDAVATLDADDGIGCIVITGAGEKAFSAG